MDDTPIGYNVNSASVRRLMKEAKEMAADTSTLYRAAPLGDNLFEWHFTIRGPKDTEFDGGIYHGRIIFPSDYPYKPPDIVFLTENGRFELDKKICLTISSHHAETWRPSWSIRTVLVALIAFLPTKGDGAVASLDWPAEERKRLAKKSMSYKCSKCGSTNLAALPPEDINETVRPEDVPEDLQLRDSKKLSSSQPASSLNTSSNPPKDEANVELTQSVSQLPSNTRTFQTFTTSAAQPQSSSSNSQVVQTPTPNIQPPLERVQPQIQIPAAAAPENPMANPAIPPVTQDSKSLLTAMVALDIFLSSIVFLIGLIVLHRLWCIL